jgi:hypothetical protein
MYSKHIEHMGNIYKNGQCLKWVRTKLGLGKD